MSICSLRLFEPDPQAATGPPRQASPEMDLGAFYEEFWLPERQTREHRPRHAETIALDRQALQEWRWTHGRLPIGRTARTHWYAFLGDLKRRTYRGRPRAPATINKLATHLRTILNAAADYQWLDGDRWRVGLVELPRLPLPQLAPPDPSPGFSLEEIGRLLSAVPRCPGLGAAWIEGEPEPFWRSLILFGHNTALRPKSIFGARGWMLDHKARDWLWLPADALKRSPAPMEFFLNAAARAALESVAPRLSPPDPLFGWRGWPGTKPAFYACWRALIAAAGLPRDAVFYRFRRATLNWLLVENEAAARLVAGHRTGGAMDFYARRYEIVPPHLSRLPQPQLRLF